MTTFVALLRAVNVSGQNRLRMAALRERLVVAGLGGVQTYLQSGNVVFASRSGDAATQAAAVHEVIAREFGLDVTVIVVSASGLADAAAGGPFARDGVDDATLYATFTSAPVPVEVFAGLSLPAQPGERAVLLADGPLSGRVIYLRLPHGYGRTKLNNAYFERALKTPATTRNWRTVMALVNLGSS